MVRAAASKEISEPAQQQALHLMPDARDNLTREETAALTLLARLLVRALLSDRKPSAQNPLDCGPRAEAPLCPMNGENEP